jgi:hypothetical protein
MRAFHHLFLDVDRQLEGAAQAKQRLDFAHSRTDLRPRATLPSARRAATLTGSRALVKLVGAEWFPDDLYTAIMGNVDRVPREHWRHVIAIAVAFRHRWRRDSLSLVARRRRSSIALNPSQERLPARTPDHHAIDSRARLGPVKALRFASTPRGGAAGLDWALGRATDRLVRDGRGVLKTVRDRREASTRSAMRIVRNT